MSDSTRRRLLAVTGSLGAVAVAGCLGDSDDEDDDPENDTQTASNVSDDADDGDDEDNSDDADDEDEDDEDDSEFDGVDGTVLGDISVDNLHDEDHEVDVQVEINGETQAWRTISLEAREGGVSLEREWSTDGGTFRVRVRLDGEGFREVTPSDWNDPDCLNLLVVIGGDGDLRVAGDTTSGYCDA